MKNIKHYPIPCLIVIGLVYASTAWSGERVEFDSDWKFSHGDVPGANVVAYDDSHWRTLDVPHDWSIEGEYSQDHPMGDRCGYLPAGFGWYRKTIAVPESWKGKHVEIAFEGVCMNSKVWANGKKLGTRPYGWISFAYDITELVATSNSITFAVRVDNDKQPSARWYTGSGIYSHVWIDVQEKMHVVRDGLFVRSEGDRVDLEVEIANTSRAANDAKVSVSILDPGGKQVFEKSKAIELPSNATGKTAFRFPIPSPMRWEPDQPYLYTAVATVVDDSGQRDSTTTRFGIRDIQWIPETGMWLNGKNVKLRGVYNHHDAGALGAAVPDKILRFRIQQLKAMGCNAIRTTHCPQTPLFYDLCDELGMMVMDEVFDGWMRKAEHDYGAHSFGQWWNRDLTDWVRRDRNHPCVVIYCLGNETRGDVGKELVARCHALDPTRPVTSGHSGSEWMDVLGVNGASEKMGFFDDLEDDRVLVGTENTHTWQVRGFYRTQTWYRNGYPSKKQRPYKTPDLTETEIFSDDWTNNEGRANAKQIFNSSYDNAMVRLTSRRNIQQLRDKPNFAGSFRWTGYDYLGEAGYVHGGWPFKAFMGGAIDLANFEKDLYYLYQSQWTKTPMVHILPHWTHPTMERGTKIPVWIYSNCPDVELFFDGKSLGSKSPGKQWHEMQCEWMVPWNPGELKAVGNCEDGSTIVQTVRTAAAPSQIKLTIDGEPLTEVGKDIVQVRVASQDSHGEFYPYGENRTHFHVLGPARIRALDNGSPIDVETHYEATDRIAFYGLTRAYIESTGEAGDITLLASCILGEKKHITANEVSIDTKLLSLRGREHEPKIEIFYTTDDSSPTIHSTRYDGRFRVPLGTTVNALVLVDGKEVQELSERFAEDEGFVWDSGQSTGPVGEQAEDAQFSQAQVSATGVDFRGKGFLQFSKKNNGFVQWYQENDGDAGNADLGIRYSGTLPKNASFKVKVSVNGKVIHPNVILPSTGSTGMKWKTVTVEIPIDRGANSIRLTPVRGPRLCIDEISVR